MNENKYKEFDLLNTYLKFNYKTYKINEIKLYVNDIYICRIGYHSYYIYKKIYDVNFKVIKSIKDIDLDKILVDVFSFDSIKDGLKIVLYTKLYNLNKEKNKVVIPSNNIIEKKEMSYIMNNEQSTILDDEQLNILNWLNN